MDNIIGALLRSGAEQAPTKANGSYFNSQSARLGGTTMLSYGFRLNATRSEAQLGPTGLRKNIGTSAWM